MLVTRCQHQTYYKMACFCKWRVLHSGDICADLMVERDRFEGIVTLWATRQQMFFNTKQGTYEKHGTDPLCLSNDFLQNTTTEFTCSQQICSTMLLVTKVSTGFRNYCFFGHYLCFLHCELSVHMGGWHCAINTSWNLLPFSRNMTLKSICHPSWYIPCRRRCP